MTSSTPSSGHNPEVAPFETLTQAGVAVVALSENGTILGASSALETLTGLSPDTFQGQSITEFIPATPPALDTITTTKAIPASPIRCRFPLTTADNSIISCELYLTPTRTPPTESEAALVGTLSKKPVSTSSPQIASDSRDTTPSQATEEAPARAFVALADALQEGIIVLDATSQIQYANPAVERILGYKTEELVGGSKLSIIPDRLEDVHLSALNTYLETGERNINWEYVELPGQHKDGHEVPLGISLNEFTFNGETYFVGLFRDIAPRKEAEEALRNRERELTHYKEYTNDILNAIDDVFYVLDREGNLLRWNTTLTEVTGYTDSEIESMTAGDFFEAGTRTDIEEAVETGFANGATRVSAKLKTKTGEQIPYEFAASRLKTPDGTTVLAGVGRDISAQKEYEAKLEESNTRLEQFAYAASHDLQEPLRMVSSYLRLLETRYDNALDEDGQEFLEYAVDGADRMREMIDGLLEYSRVETRGDPFEPTNLNCILDDIREDFKLRISETNASLTIESLPTVRGDPNQLYQLLQNLVENALKYSDGDEPPEVRVTAEQHDETVTVSVHDNGIGIAKPEQERVFTVFDRLHSRDEYDGTGIGLALCRRIVERHGGDIWVDSEPGEGATFSFTIPRP